MVLVWLCCLVNSESPSGAVVAFTSHYISILPMESMALSPLDNDDRMSPIIIEDKALVLALQETIAIRYYRDIFNHHDGGLAANINI